MPPRRIQKQAPAASRNKRVLHALYLAQPFLQFLALMAVFLVLARCSPLAPSTDRRLNKISSDGVVSTRSRTSAEEEDIKQSLKEVTDSVEMPILARSEYDAAASAGLIGSKPADAAAVRAILQDRALTAHPRRKQPIFSFLLTAEQRSAFQQSGSVRVNLAEFLSSSMSAEPRKLLLGELRKMEDLEIRAVLVLPDAATQEDGAVSSIPLHTKTKLGFIADDKAFLLLRRMDDHLDESQHEVVKSNLDRAIAIAIQAE